MALFRRRTPAADDSTSSARGSSGPTPAQVGPATTVTDDACSPAVSTNWMVAATLAEGAGQSPLRGTPFHQPQLAPLAWGVWEASPPTDLLSVQLAVVSAGQWVGAVGVYAAGIRVASVPAEDAEKYRPVVAALADVGLPATSRAVITGGHPRGARGPDALRFGLALLSPKNPAPARPDQPFLPGCIGYQAFVLDELAAELDANLPSRAKNYIRRCTGHVGVDGALVVDGQPVGRLGLERPEELALVRAAATAGHPTTCAVRMIRAPGRALRIMADLPSYNPGPAGGGLTFDLP